MSPAVPRTGRTNDALRPVTLERNVAPYAEGSCMVSFGMTRVLCAATVDEGVPDWRAGAGAGWVTGEYAMLPRSTHRRTGRERAGARGRTQEIQRLIGRALRASIDLTLLGERTITLDCDVLVADGGTRTAAITGAAVALHDACSHVLAKGLIAQHPVRELVAAVSVGIVNGEHRIDLEYREDVAADVDMNLVVLESGPMVEVQGTGERTSFSDDDLTGMLRLGRRGLSEIFVAQRNALGI